MNDFVLPYSVNWEIVSPIFGLVYVLVGTYNAVMLFIYHEWPNHDLRLLSLISLLGMPWVLTDFLPRVKRLSLLEEIQKYGR